jgi:hypothetical protein
MAKDTFNIDAQLLETAAGYLERMQKSMSGTADQAFAMQGALELAGKARAQLADIKIMDPDKAQEMLKNIQELEKRIVSMGGSYQKIVDTRKQEMMMARGQVLRMDELSRKEKRYVKDQAATMTQQKEFVKFGEQVVELKNREEINQGKIGKYLKDQGRQLKNYFTSMAGLQVSLVGIIALLVEAANKGRKIGAMSQQVASHWSSVNLKTEEASGMIGQIRYGMKQSLDVSGAYVNSLAQAGLNLKQMKMFNVELLALEKLHGVAAQEQLGVITNMVNEYQKTDEEAGQWNRTLQLATKHLRGKGGIAVSMQEVMRDMGELTELQKVYNADLTGTLGMYNALARQDMAERLGLGEAPLEIRKAIAKTVVGFSAELEDGWKAALGEGATVASRILEFEKLLPAEQFGRMAEFISEKTSQFAGDEREFAIRKLLMQFGFTSKQVRKVLAESFAQGGLDKDALQETMSTFADARKDAKDIMLEANKKRKELIQKGTEVAVGLTSLQELIRIWIEKKIVPVAMKLYRAIMTLADKIPDPVTAGKNIGQAAADYIGGKAPGLEPEYYKTKGYQKYKREFGGLEGIEAFAKAARQAPEVQSYLSSRRGIELATAMPSGYKTAAMVERLLKAKEALSTQEWRNVVNDIREGAAHSALNKLFKRAKDENTRNRAVNEPEAGYVDPVAASQ